MSLAWQSDVSFENSAPDAPRDELQAYLEHGLYAVEGWGLDPFLANLFLILNAYQEAERISGNLLEIGVHHGRSAILVALMAKPEERPVFIDLFDRQDENLDHSGRGDRDKFEANLQAWAPSRASEIVQANTMDLKFSSVAALSAGVRFAHIDGGHYRAVVLNDIRKTEAVLKEGGIVVVDDFFHSRFPEVNEACNAYLEKRFNRKLAPVALGHNKLVLTTLKRQQALVAHLRKAGDEGKIRIDETVTFHGYPVICLDPQQ